MPGWSMDDLSCTRLPEKRLSKRLDKLVSALAAMPQASVPQACGKAGAKAAYRFWANRRMTPQALREAQVQATVQRIWQRQADGGPLEVEVIQDTTSLDFTSLKKTPGLGPLENRHCQGLLVHTALAVAGGVPLGVIQQQMWVRPPSQQGKRHRRRQLPIEQKESYRWITTLRGCRAALGPGMRVIHLADREADIYELFAEEREAGEELLIRVAHNRVVQQEQGYLWPAVRCFAAGGTLRVQLPRSGNRPQREAGLTVRFGTVTLRPPRNGKKRRGLAPVSLQAVLAEEMNPPAGVKAVCWLLLTTLQVGDFQTAVGCVRRYGRRWLIERYHFVFKSGCGVEELQLQEGIRLERAAATYSLVAWRVLWLTYESRAHPEQSCLTVLGDHEWQALYATIHRTRRMPRAAPSLGQAVHWIAQLGGFMGRKGDGDPGPKTLWRGLRRLHDISATWQLLNPPTVPP